MTQTTNIADLRKAGGMTAKQAGGTTVAAFFEQNKTAMQAVLPKHIHPDRMLKLALQAIRTTPQLMECTTGSLMGAVMQCAQMGLEPNTVLGHAYLVPFRNKKKQRQDVQVIVGYKGLIDLARRSGQIESIASHAVHKNDKFEVALGTDDRIVHVPALEVERGPVIAFYAVAKLKGGGHAFEVMSKSQVDAVRDGSQGYQNAKKYKSDNPWISSYEEMGRKTVIRRLSKYLPLSIEFATAATLDGMAETGKDQNLEGVLTGEYSVVDSHDEELTLEQQWEKYDEILTTYGEREAENFMPNEPRPEQKSEKAAATKGPDGDDLLKAALHAVSTGDYDAARDLANTLPKKAVDQVEAAIAARENTGKPAADKSGPKLD